MQYRIPVPRGGTGAGALQPGYVRSNGASAYASTPTIPGADVTGPVLTGAVNGGLQKGQKSVAANGTFSGVVGGHGLYHVHDVTNGTSALILYQGAAAPVIVAQVGAAFVLVDPGPGGLAWFVANVAGALVLTNRYLGAVDIAGAVLSARSTNPLAFS